MSALAEKSYFEPFSMPGLDCSFTLIWVSHKASGCLTNGTIVFTVHPTGPRLSSFSRTRHTPAMSTSAGDAITEPEPAEHVEQLLLTIREVFVYKLPPLTSSAGYRCVMQVS
jgi:hypothetical protein